MKTENNLNKVKTLIFGMNKTTLMIIVIALTILPLVSASLGTFKQFDCLDIKTIQNTTSVNLSTLSYPNGIVAVSNQPMTNLNGKTWNYTFCDTIYLGQYNYDYYDADGNVFVNSFDVTIDGQEPNTGMYTVIMFTIFSIILLMIGFLFDNYIFSFLSGMSFTITGVYAMINGFSTFDTNFPRMMAVLILGMGLILMIASAISLMKEYSSDEDLASQNEEVWDI